MNTFIYLEVYFLVIILLVSAFFFLAIYDFSPSTKSHKFCNNYIILFLVFLSPFWWARLFFIFFFKFYELRLRKFSYDVHLRGRCISVYLQDENCLSFVASEQRL